MSKITETIPPISYKKGKFRKKLEDLYDHFGTMHLSTTIKVLINTTHKELYPELHEQYKQEETEENPAQAGA
ncbi:MAG: hypothetical protein AAF806_30940 [Bacteroidota bacterium]